jgi:hypothetical protein
MRVLALSVLISFAGADAMLAQAECYRFLFAIGGPGCDGIG